MPSSATVPRYYARPSDAPKGRTFYFRVSAGYFDRWDADTKTWDHIEGRGRDYCSRAIENGDAYPTTVEEAEHS